MSERRQNSKDREMLLSIGKCALERGLQVVMEEGSRIDWPEHLVVMPSRNPLHSRPKNWLGKAKPVEANVSVTHEKGDPQETQSIGVYVVQLGGEYTNGKFLDSFSETARPGVEEDILSRIVKAWNQ